MKEKIIVVLGPTAVGKSDLAVSLAKRFNGEVISADSRQVYKGMNIGTGKITKGEMRSVPHYLLDVASPLFSDSKGGKKFSVADFQTLAYKAIEDILRRRKTPIICGGTGFYIQSIVDGIVLPEVAADPTLRKKLEHKSAEELVKILSKLDKKRIKTIDLHNKVRLVRAIEIAKSLGKVPAIRKDPKYATLQIGLDIPDEELKNKISKRIEVRMKKGMLNEARKLHIAGLSYKRMQEFGLEYRHLADMLASAKTHTRTRASEKKLFNELLAMDIWHYAKRQRTWFYRDRHIKWHNPYKKSEMDRISKEVKDFLNHPNRRSLKKP